MDLNAPIGLKPPLKRRRRFATVTTCGALGLGLVGLGFFFATADPHGGEPFAVAKIPAPPAPTPASAPDPMPTGSLSDATPARRDRASQIPADSVATIEGGIKVFRGGRQAPTISSQGSGQGAGPLVIDVSRALDEQARNKTRSSGPKVTTGAASSTSGPTSKPNPRIAIFVSGMGLSASATRTATETMPAAVDLAFVPYGETVALAVATAKARGHEILLQIPMQTGTTAAPGPHAIRPNEPARDLAADLAWLTGRFSGYAGVTNLLGRAVTADNAVMTTLLKSVASRRLFYVDDGTSKGSIAASLAPGLGVSVLNTDVVLDATADSSVVRANLDKLVAVARQKGQAIGMASGLPDHLGTIATFAGELAGKGISLVPVSALTGRDAAVATAR